MTYRVTILGREKPLATGLTREAAIDLAGDNYTLNARIWNEQTGQELINSHDGTVKEA